MDNKYQIFISSTFEDLEKHRGQVIKSVLEMGHIPVGMEMFSAADEEQWKLIARQIDQSDYYVVIVAHRYGSMHEGLGYTEKEFDYAVSRGIPVYGFVVARDVQPLAKDIDSEPERVAALEKFKAKVKQRPVTFWSTAEELGGKVPIALMKAFQVSPRPGWTRVTSQAGPEVVQELSRLSNENAQLRKQLENAVLASHSEEKAQISSVMTTLKGVKVKVGIREKGKSSWDEKAETTLYGVFSIIAPSAMVEVSVRSMSRLLALSLKPTRNFDISVTAPVALNFVNLLIADLSALGLVEPSKRKHEVKDTEVYWTLSEFGKELLKADRHNILAMQVGETP